MKKDWKPLWAIFILGILGGVLYEAGDVFIRLWSRDEKLGVEYMDILNAMEIVHPLKFLWAPIFSLPLVLGRWSHRRAWLLVTLVGVLMSVLGLCISPFWGVAFLCLLMILTLARASYDALVIASQMDAVHQSSWGFSENSCVLGYRIGPMVVGYLVLRASDWGVDWPCIYLALAGIITLGAAMVAYHPLFHFLNAVHVIKKERVRDSIRYWIKLPGSGWVLLFLLIYRLQDGLIDPNRDYFLLDYGVSKVQLAGLKNLASCGTISAGIGAGLCIRYMGYRRALVIGLIMHGCSGGLLYACSWYDWPQIILKIIYVLEQTTKGWATISIYSFQLLCCQGENKLSQVALFSALSDMGIKLIAVRAGWIANEYGWSMLMGAASLCGIPALLLLPYIFSKTFIGEKIPAKAT